MSLLKIWFGATAVFIAGAMIWSFAPVLVPLLALTAAIGLLVVCVVALARWIERRRLSGKANLEEAK